MKPKVLFISVLTLSICTIFFTKLTAQVTQTIGASTPIGIRTDSDKNTEVYYMGAFSYGFRYPLSITENSSFSIGPLASIGGGFYDDYSGFIYSGDVQAWADYNHGMGAVADPAKNTGVYVGLGFGVSYTGIDGEAIDEYSGISVGPMIRAGFRFGVLDIPLGIGLYYKHGLEKSKWRTFGFHILADF